MSDVSLVWITSEAESLIAHIARVSSPSNQDNPNYVKLLKYLIDHKHWSPFETVSACLSIHTSRRIAPQILRHRSFSFQEFSTRYSTVDGFVNVHPRRQDITNRQSSIDDLPEKDLTWFENNKTKLEQLAMEFYKEGLTRGISKESMAFVLPMSAKTHIYMAGTLRSWIHWIELRTDPATQLEHRDIAEEAKKIFIKELPTISSALGWTSPKPEDMIRTVG